MLQRPNNPLANRRRQAGANKVFSKHREKIFSSLDGPFESVVLVNSHPGYACEPQIKVEQVLQATQ
jgi:hypothetical protein